MGNSQAKAQVVEVEKHGGIAYVYLNRPHKKNAMSFVLLKALHRTAKQLAKDKSVRVVILAGKEHTFSAGIDLADLNNPAKASFALWELAKPCQSLFQKAFTVWQTLPVPVIAVLEGHCIGAGMQLALAADVRISTPTCKLAIMESRWGLVPDMGITYSMQGLVRPDIAKELTMTARMITADEAHTYGLVTHVHEEPMQQAVNLANEIITRSPDSVLAGKRVLNAMLYRSKKALYQEKLWQLKLILGKNSRIAMNAKDTLPKFKKRQFR